MTNQLCVAFWAWWYGFIHPLKNITTNEINTYLKDKCKD